MSDVVSFTATSADGFIADGAGSLDWLFEVPEEATDGEAWNGFIGPVGALVLGSTTYEWVLDHESLREHPERWREYYGDRPAWVFTHRDLPVVTDLDIRFVRGDVAALHPAIVESAAGGDVWVVGGGGLAGQYADAGLLDRIEIAVTPVFLGGGAPLLPRRLTSERIQLESAVQDGQRARLRFSVGPPLSR